MQCVLTFVTAFLLLSELPSSKAITSEGTPQVSQDNFTTNKSNDTLIFANVIFRHGDRNTQFVYPNDPNEDGSNWPGGFGALTNKGKRQMFDLGQFLRRRYKSILSESYSSEGIYVLSTDSDQAIMSAEAALAGLFPPTSEEEIWNEEINWQPVPVHSVPLKSDKILLGLQPCPKFNILFVKYLKESPEMRLLYIKYGKLFQYWSQQSGMNIKTPLDVFLLHDILRNEKEHNLIIPEWAEEACRPNGPMDQITNAVYKSITGTPELARLRFGFLIKDMLEHFSQKINSILRPNRSVWLYSAHDLVIANALNSLGLFEPHFPPVASSLHFELYKTDEREYYFQLFYRSSSEEHLSPLNIPKCGEKCFISTFITEYGYLIPDDYESECES